MMDKIRVSFEGKDYIVLHQYSSGFCEIKEEDHQYWDVKLVHASELTFKE